MSETPGDMLLRALDADPAQAETKLISLRKLLIWYFGHNQLPDSEDLCQEVICRVIKSLSDGKKITATKPQSYLLGFAANVLLEQRKARRRQPLQLSEELPEPRRGNVSRAEIERTEASILVEEYTRCLEQEERDLLISYYHEGREKLSRRLGISCANLTLRVHRIKKKIREHIENPKQDATDTPG